VEQDAHLQELYDASEQSLSSECKSTLKEVLCLSCQPYAAHVFDAETTMNARNFPGLCTDYCTTLHSQCPDVISQVTDDEAVLEAALQSADEFCATVAIPDMDYCYPELETNPVFEQTLHEDFRTEDGCLCLEEHSTGLRNPLILRTPPDNSGRLFIAEQVGIIYIYDKQGSRLPDPFLDITNLVLTSARRGDERGLLGLAFHPDFAINDKFYLYFSISSGTSQRTRLSEFLVDSDNPNVVKSGSERVILEQVQPFANHNGGEVFFGQDDYLYVSLGDGGAAGDPYDNSQNMNTWLGKMLRIDVNVPEDMESTHEYVVPPDNPFVDTEGVLPEIYAYGLRNVWRCDVDEGDATTGEDAGRIICGDVGQSAFEEIDLIVKGGNYGWKIREGFSCFQQNSECDTLEDDELPIHAYAHGTYKSVTGGHVYRGCANPALYGQYIYGDFVDGSLWSLKENKETGTWENRDITMCGDDVCFNGLLNTYNRKILSFGEDDDGEIYMLTTSFDSTGSAGGAVYKFVDPRRRGDPQSCRSLYQESPATTTDSPTGKFKIICLPLSCCIIENIP